MVYKFPLCHWGIYSDLSVFHVFLQMFMWDACKDLTLVILMVAAAASLALGIKSEVRFAGKVMM